MKIDKQVCSLELAKKLKELNVKQESLFCWCGKGEHIKIMLNSIYDSECNPHLKICSAFTVAEVGDMLPKILKYKDYTSELHCTFDLKGLSYIFYVIDDEHIDHELSDSSEANVRAKMLIYLLENGLLKNDNT